MTAYGRYGTPDRHFALPEGWESVSADVMATARDQALAAVSGDDAIRRTARYYDPSSAYAGTLFLDATPNDPHTVEASDLYAVTTLSMTLHPRHGRLLREPGKVRERVQALLRNLPDTVPITDIERGDGGSADLLARMYELHAEFRGLLAGNSKRWVTAAKLCARKRPSLFPVRDNLVCGYLGGGRPLKSGDGWPGDFSVDMQVYAYLMTEPTVVDALASLRGTLTNAFGLRLDAEDLRLLDSALWMAASGQANT